MSGSASSVLMGLTHVLGPPRCQQGCLRQLVSRCLWSEFFCTVPHLSTSKPAAVGTQRSVCHQRWTYVLWQFSAKTHCNLNRLRSWICVVKILRYPVQSQANGGAKDGCRGKLSPVSAVWLHPVDLTLRDRGKLSNATVCILFHQSLQASIYCHSLDWLRWSKWQCNQYFTAQHSHVYR